jgi:hypothetical protein
MSRALTEPIQRRGQSGASPQGSRKVHPALRGFSARNSVYSSPREKRFGNGGFFHDIHPGYNNRDRCVVEAIKLMETHIPKAVGRDVGEARLDWLHCLILRSEAKRVRKSIRAGSKK